MNPNARVNAAPETPPARPKSELPLPSFPLHIFPSQNRDATPESHSFSSLQAERGSFSIPGDSSKKPFFSTHTSLTKASDAFRFLQDRYNKALPPTPGVHNPRGRSVNDAVAESSSPPKTAATSRRPRMSFVHEPERQTLQFNDAPYNLSPNAGHVSFSADANALPGSHISHSRTISPLGSPLPVLTRIQPCSSSFSRARRGSNHSSSDETTAPSPSQSLSESSRCSPQSGGMSPRTPLTSELLQGSPVYARIRAPPIVRPPSQSSNFEYLQDKRLSLGSRQDAGFADQKGIRTNCALHTTSGAHDIQNYNCHVPTHSVYMESSTREDPQSPIGRSVTREGRTGLGISFNFNSGSDIMESDSVGDGLDDDQLNITPGRPTVVLVPSGRQSDRSEAPASASASASVNLKLESEGCGPRFAPGRDPRFPLEFESQSSLSSASSFYTAHEILAEPEMSSRTYGDGHACNGTSGTSKRTSGTPRLTAELVPSLHLDLPSNGPLAASAGPAAGVSSSPRWQDQRHHGIPPAPRIGLCVGMDTDSRGWMSTSSLVSESSRDEYSRFVATRQTTPVPWSQFVLPGSGSGRR